MGDLAWRWTNWPDPEGEDADCSRTALDALLHASGPVAERVNGEAILWRVDAEELLHDFARRCALDVIHLWDAPDVVREYLETGDEDSRGAAWALLEEEVRDTAWTGLWLKAWAPARASACAAASTSWRGALAASDASAVALKVAARDVGSAFLSDLEPEREKQNRRLTAMVSAKRYA